MSDHEEEFDFDQAGSGASLTYPKVAFNTKFVSQKTMKIKFGLVILKRRFAITAALCNFSTEKTEFEKKICIFRILCFSFESCFFSLEIT